MEYSSIANMLHCYGNSHAIWYMLPPAFIPAD